MTRLDRRMVLAGLGSMGLGACAGPLRIGEGKKLPKGGIGGTGIVGTLTDFGSLIVNGLRVETDASTGIADAFGAVSAEALKIGQALTVEAATGPGGLVARTVRIVHPVIGPVQRVSASGREGVVAGVRVALEQGAIGRLDRGARVAVSGLWQGRRVIASRIDTLPRSGPAAIAGVIERSDGATGRIAGVAVRSDAGPLPQAGSFATVTGRLARGRLVASAILPGRFSGSAGPLVNLSVEGYLEPAPEAPYLTISGLGHSFDEAARLERIDGRRALFTGPYREDFVVDRAMILPEALPSRRRLSAGMAAGTTIVEALSTR